MSPLDSLAAVVALAGMLAAGLALIATHSPLQAITTLLDFFVAAALLRLAGEQSWPGLGQTASIMVLRHIIHAGLRQAERGRQDTPKRPPGHATPA